MAQMSPPYPPAYKEIENIALINLQNNVFKQ